MPPRIPSSSSSVRCLHQPLLISPSPAKATILRTAILPLPTAPQSFNYATTANITTKNTYPKHKIAKTLGKLAPTTSNNTQRSHPPTLPPSFKPANLNKTLLTRIYLSLLRSSPLTVIFQHNSVTATEWTAIRRELGLLLSKVDAGLPEGEKKLAQFIKITTVNPPLLGVAMRIADTPAPGGKLWSHGTSEEAAMAAMERRKTHYFSSMVAGPVAVLTFPVLSPKHIEAAMEMMFPAKKGPQKKGFDPAATAGLAKCILLAARVQERPVGMWRAMGDDGIRRLSTLKTVEEMRGEAVALLQSSGGGEIVRALESIAISLGRTMEGRRKMLEEEAGGPKEEVKPEA